MIICLAVSMLMIIGGIYVLYGSMTSWIDSEVAGQISSRDNDSSSVPASSLGSSQASAPSKSSSSGSGSAASVVPSSEAGSSAPVRQTNLGKPAGYFDDAAFIGDSRTQGLELYNGLGDASYFAVKGLTVRTAVSKPALTVDGQKLTVVQAVSKKQYGKVYIMLGMNELGWSSTDQYLQEYGKLIDTVKKDQPHAKIYVQSILPVSQKKSQEDKVFSNANIEVHNKLIRELAKKKGVSYLDAASALADSRGNLPDGASSDGVHLNQEYCKKWCLYLQAHK